MNKKENLNLDAMSEALKVQDNAAYYGFDWQEVAPVFGKITEECLELKEAVNAVPSQEWAQNTHVQMELGDLLFCVLNLARHLGVEPHYALKVSSDKFVNRFRYMQENVHCFTPHNAVEHCTKEQWETLWQAAKLATDTD